MDNDIGNYRLISKKRFKRLIKGLLTNISPVNESKRLYKKAFNKKLNLKTPKTFNEKLMWLKLNTYYKNPLVTKCADKYKVRDYIVDSGYGNILVDLIDTWDSVEEIDWSKLPNKFALKCNHGAGYNIICNNKNNLNVEREKKRLNTWMKEDYSNNNAEIHYKDIERKIICEKYINDSDDLFPVDYKIYCFNGEPKFIGNFIERDEITSNIKRGYFNFSWEYQDILKEEYKYDKSKFRKPKTLDLMYKIAKELSQPFPFVRIDFYEYDDTVIFGEFTFTPSACLATYYSDDALEKLGHMIVLPYSHSN